MNCEVPEEPLVYCSASELDPSEVADLLQRGYAGYAVTIDFTVSLLEDMVRVHGVDLEASTVALCGGERVAVALVGRRGACERLAAFCVTEAARGQGVGRRLCGAVIHGSQERGARSLELEVLGSNAAAIALYRSLGFQSIQTLLGFQLDGSGGQGTARGSKDEPKEINVQQLASALRSLELRLPWQSAADSLKRMEDARAYRLGNATIAVRDGPNDAIRVLAVATHGDQGDEQLRRLFRALQEQYRSRRWFAPPLFPSDVYQRHFEGLGFSPIELTQLHMELIFP